MSRGDRRPPRLLVALGLVLLVAGGALAQTRAEAIAELQRTTREYQASLARLLALHEQGAAAAAAHADKLRDLESRGLVSRRDVTRAEEATAAALARAAETRTELEESERVLVETDGLLRLALQPPIAPGRERATQEVVEYAGAGRWALDQVAGLERFFAERFGRPLPVSAVGQTPLHDRLGFDHRNAVDIALHPDSAEGRALLTHLRARGVPFLAFRTAVPGAATGAHVHVGAPSRRWGASQGSPSPRGGALLRGAPRRSRAAPRSGDSCRPHGARRARAAGVSSLAAPLCHGGWGPCRCTRRPRPGSSAGA